MKKLVMLGAIESAELERFSVKEGLARFAHYHLACNPSCTLLPSYWRSPNAQQARRTIGRWLAYEKAIEVFFIRSQCEHFFKVSP